MPNRRRYKNSNVETDLAQKAYFRIRQMLFHNEIVPGQKIAYRDLAERLGMSSTPVIQALKFLEFQGVVRHEPNRGYYTESIKLQEVQEVYELREMIEVALLPRTLKCLNEENIQQLQTVHEAHLAAVKNIYPNARILKNMEFHLILASLSRCSIYKKILQNLFDLMILKYRSGVIYITPMKITDPVHQNLFNAIVDRNLSRAQQNLSAHILDAKKYVIMGLERMIEEKQVLTI